jgi:hypothetical protein
MSQFISDISFCCLLDLSYSSTLTPTQISDHYLQLDIVDVFQTLHACCFIEQLMRTILSELNLVDRVFGLQTYLCDIGKIFRALIR